MTKMIPCPQFSFFLAVCVAGEHGEGSWVAVWRPSGDVQSCETNITHGNRWKLSVVLCQTSVVRGALQCIFWEESDRISVGHGVILINKMIRKRPAVFILVWGLRACGTGEGHWVRSTTGRGR